MDLVQEPRQRASCENKKVTSNPVDDRALQGCSSTHHALSSKAEHLRTDS